MDKIEEWNECRTKIPPGKYELTCFKAERTKIWHEGKNGWGKSEKIILWFEVLQGEHVGKVVPMFLPLKLDERGNATGKVPQDRSIGNFGASQMDYDDHREQGLKRCLYQNSQARYLRLKW